MEQAAVIKTGGKQYLVSPGQKIKIELISKAEKAKEKAETKAKDKEIIFDQVLLLQKGNKVEVGMPFVKNAKVVGKILKEDKAKKVVIFKYKSKKREKTKKGHRQPYMEVEIVKISN